MEDERYVVVNPGVEEKTDEKETDIEGCLSIPGIGVEVERHEGVVVLGQDAEGRLVRRGQRCHRVHDATRDKLPGRHPDAGPDGPRVAQTGHAPMAERLLSQS